MDEPATIGVMFRREHSPDRLANYARRVEDAGFDELWVVEDCFYTGGIAQAATALAATREITVGLGIAPAVARNAAFLAMEFATLGRMHPGRFHGGIGHGVAEWMEQIGARPSSWLAALEETTVAVRSLLAGEEVSTAGRTVELSNVRLERAPDPPPLVSLGVRSTKSLELAGRCADGTVLAEGSSPSYVRWVRERIEEGRDGGRIRSPHRVTVYALCAVSGSDPDGARSEIRRDLAPFLSAGGTSPQVAALPYAAEVDALIANGDAESLKASIPDEWLADLAITGTPEDGDAAIARLHDAGADAVVLVPVVSADPDAWLQVVASELLPLVRARA